MKPINCESTQRALVPNLYYFDFTAHTLKMYKLILKLQKCSPDPSFNFPNIIRTDDKYRYCCINAVN